MEGEKMNNSNNELAGKKEKKTDDFPKAERLTAVFLLISVLIWGLYDSFMTGKIGVPLYLIIITSVFNRIAIIYYKKKKIQKRK